MAGGGAASGSKEYGEKGAMNCTDFEGQWAALEGGEELTAPLADHLRGCRRCAELIEDLRAIQEQAHGLRLAEDPPQRVWVAVRNQLEREGLIREPAAAARRPAWGGLPAFGWLARFPMALAYAGVFFLALGVVYFYSQSTSSGPQPPTLVVTAPVPDIAWTRPNTAESDRNVEEMLARIPEEHRATFVSNWNRVNSSIRDWQSYLETHPDDPFAGRQLLNSLQQREFLRQTLVGREEF